MDNITRCVFADLAFISIFHKMVPFSSLQTGTKKIQFGLKFKWHKMRIP